MKKIHPRQFMILTVLYTIGTSLLIIPSHSAAVVKQDAWLASIGMSFINLLYIVIYILLMHRFPGLNLVQIAEKLLGKWLGNVLAWLYITFFLLLAALLLNYIGQFIHTSILTSTPVWFIYATFALVVVIGIKYGLEAYARSAELFFPIILIFLSLIMLMLVFEVDVSKLLPIAEHSLSSLFLSGLKMSAFQEHICLLMLVHLVDNKNKQTAARALFTGSALGLAVLFAITLLTLLILGSYNTGHALYSVYVLVKKVSIGDFFQRIEILMIAIWFLTVFVKICITTHASLIGMAQSLKMKSCKPLVFPVGLLIAVYSMFVMPNTAAFFEFVNVGWFPYGLLLMFVFPLCFLIIDFVKQLFSSSNDSGASEPNKRPYS